jgi:hypothetical protein
MELFKKATPPRVAARLNGDPVLRPFRAARWVAPIALLVPLGIVAAWMAWDARAEHRLQQARAALPPRGAVAVEVAEPVPPEDNAATLLIEAGKVLDLKAFSGVFANSPDFYNSGNPTLSADQLDHIRRHLNANEAPLRLLRQATTRPALQWPVESVYQPEPGQAFVDVYNLAYLLRYAAADAVAKGDDARARQDALNLLFLARAFRSDTSDRSGYAAQYSMQIAERFIASVPSFQLPAKRTAEGDALADVLRTIQRSLLTVESDRTQYRKSLIRHMDSLKEKEPNAGWPGPDPMGPASTFLTRPVWQGRKVRGIEMTQIIFEMLDRPGPLPVPVVIKPAGLAGAPSRVWWPPIAQIENFPTSTLNNWLQFVRHAAVMGDSSRGLLSAQLALRLYRYDHAGALPESLEALIPDYLPAVPIDALDPAGGAIRYSGPTTQPFVYSVGPNGADETALGLLKPDASYHARLDAPDFVYMIDVPPATTQPALPGR